MTEIPKITNGKTWLQKGLLQVLVIISLVAYIAVKEIAGSGEEAHAFDSRIVRLEECVRRLDTVPQDIATLKTETKNIQVTLDKIEKKLDSQK